jgi:hypothetical protein
MLTSWFAALASYVNTKKQKTKNKKTKKQTNKKNPMASDSIFLITLMIQNHLRERRVKSEAELKDERVPYKGLGRRMSSCQDQIFKSQPREIWEHCALWN